MPSFRYQPLSPAGPTAVIEAPDRAGALRALKQRGITPASLDVDASAPAAAPRTESGEPAAPTASAWQFPSRSAMSRVEMASFVRELATAIGAGLPLVQALRTIQRQTRSARPKAMLKHVIHEVENGRALAEAAASWGPPFDELTVGLIRAGEASGRLDVVLDQAAILLDRDVKLRRSMKAGLTYPAILGILIVAAIIIIVTFIVPNILKTLEGQVGVANLPWPTRVVKGSADFVFAYWWLLIGIVVAASLMWSNARRQPASRLAIDRFLLKVPALGRVLRDMAVARFTRTMATLVSAGLPALSALKTTKGTLGNKAMEEAIDRVCEEVSAGRTIADPMEASGYFPPLLVQIVSVGERSGRLPQMLAQAAGVFEERTEASVKTFTTVFPPILVIIAAVVVGFVVLAIVLPLVEMSGMIQ